MRRGLISQFLDLFRKSGNVGEISYNTMFVLLCLGHFGVPFLFFIWRKAKRTPASFPPGMPGMGEEIDGAMQHVPQPGRQAKAGAITPSRNPGQAARPPCPHTPVWR